MKEVRKLKRNRKLLVELGLEDDEFDYDEFSYDEYTEEIDVYEKTCRALGINNVDCALESKRNK